MRWNNRDRKAEWHRWFAWYPADIGEWTIWLGMVERRRVASGCMPMPMLPVSPYRWEYRAVNTAQLDDVGSGRA